MDMVSHVLFQSSLFPSLVFHLWLFFLSLSLFILLLLLYPLSAQFYAAVELKRDPSLKGKAFGVGTSILVTASYEARSYGIAPGQAGFVAEKLCPHIILVEENPRAYAMASDEVMKIFRTWDPNLSIAGLDEAYMDVTEACQERGIDVETCAERVSFEMKKWKKKGC